MNFLKDWHGITIYQRYQTNFMYLLINIDRTIYHTYYTKGYPAKFYGDEFHKFVIHLHNQYDNINILLERGETVHNNKERFQDFEQAVEIDKLCKKILEDNGLEYHTIKVDSDSVDKIIKLIK